MNFKYQLNDKPPLWDMLLFGFQWLILSIPPLIIIGMVVASLHFTNPNEQIIYMQKVFLIMAIVIIIQLYFGHRLPIIAGPAGVLLIGIIASQSESISTIYSSIFIGGIVLAILSITGLFNYIKMLFTPRIIAVILLLIAFTLTPTIIELILNKEGNIHSGNNLAFALIFVLVIFYINNKVRGMLKFTLVMWAIIGGSLSYLFIFPQYSVNLEYTDLSYVSWYLNNIQFTFSINISVVFSFLLCFLALSINDLGSIQSTGSVVNADNMDKRTNRGILITGVGNAIAGFMGVIGPVNFSLSPGIIASTSCASRHTLLPAGIGLLILSFSPLFVGLITNIPTIVIGSVLLFLMTTQIAAGLMLVFENTSEDMFNSGLIIGLPLLIGVIIAFLPSEILATFPIYIKPIVGNGFVMGVIAVLFMEHIVYKGYKKTKI